MTNWIDSHCHLNDEAFNEDVNVVLNNMAENDVTRCMLVSITPNEYIKSLTINHKDIEIKRSIGVYPEQADISEKEFNEYEKYFNEVDAIGEIGLDYHWNSDNKETQKEMFIRQIEIAKKLNKPIIVHSRDASKDTFDILKEHVCKGVIHCFSSSAELAKEYVKLGYYISIAGPVTWKNSLTLQEVIKVVPLDKMLIETDCPYLTPAPNRGKRNEPSYVIYTGKYICDKLGLDEEMFKKQINANYDNLFSK